MFKLVLEKAEGPEIKSPTSIGSSITASEFQKNIYFCFIDYAKAFVWITKNCGKFFKRWEYQTTLPTSWEICMHQEATVRTGHGKINWFQIRTGVCQGYILSPCLFNLYTEYIMKNARLDEAQAGIKIAGRIINNHWDDTTLMAESEEELKSLLMRVKEESKYLAQISTFRKRRSWHLVPSLHGKQMGNSGNSVRHYFLGLKNRCKWWLLPWN